MLGALMMTLAATAAAPGAEAEALGRRLAATGSLQAMLPMISQKETEEVVAAHPELSPAERDRLRVVATSIAERDGAIMAAAIGQEYAAALSIADLRALVAFNEGPVARRYRAAMPAATMRGMAAAGKIDFKGDVAKAFCAETGKLCSK